MKKLLCLLLAGLMLTSTVACATTNDPGEETKNSADSGDVNAETDDPNYSWDLPSDLDFKKATVSIIYPKDTNFTSEIYSERLTNNLVADSVYERNIAVEDHINVKMNYNESEDVMGDLTRDIQSGLGDFDLVSNYTYTTVGGTIEGKFLDLNQLDNISLDKHYWTQGYNDMVTFTEDEMQFLATGALSISLFRKTYLTLYNKKLFVDNHLDDLYDTVMNGEWTLDKQYSISKDHYIDKDGSGTVTEGDFFGFVTGNCVSVDPYMVATQTYLIVKDPDTKDIMFNSEAKEKLSDVCDKLQLLYNDASTYAYQGESEDNTTTPQIITHFAKENALMATSLFVQMEMNYEMLAPLSYGLAPMPKFDTNQKEYGSYVQDQVTCFGISSVVGDPDRQEMCAAVLDNMAYHSQKLVRPAYYDTALSERYMQDPESKEILDLIFDTLYFDFASTCCNMLSVQPRDLLRGLLTDTSNTIASSAKSWEKTIKKDAKAINEKLATLIENMEQ